jgi:Trp operon repressor
MSEERGVQRFCLYDEDNTNEFKAFSLNETIEININIFDKHRKKDLTDTKIDDLIQKRIKDQIKLMEENKSQAKNIFVNSFENMLDKYFCNYISCFYNSQFGKICNLHLGLDDDGIEIGIPIKKTYHARSVLYEIIRNKVAYYVKNKMIVLLDVRTNRLVGDDILNYVMSNIKMNVAKIKPIFYNEIIKKNRVVLKNVKHMISLRHANSQKINIIQNKLNKRYIEHENKYAMLIGTLYNDSHNLNMWRKVLEVLEIDNINNTYIYRELYKYKNDFTEKVKNEDSDTILEHITLWMTNLKNKVNNDGDANSRKKLEHMLRLMLADDKINKIRLLINFQKRMLTVEVPSKNYMILHNENLLKTVTRLSNGLSNMHNDYKKIIDNEFSKNKYATKINKIDDMLKYILDEYDLHIVKLSIMSPISTPYKLLFKKSDDKNFYYLSERKYLNGQISCEEVVHYFE